jgi:general secretion pathway protein L
MMATSEWLLVRLPADPAAAPVWAAVDSGGGLLALPSGDETALAYAAAGRQVALIAPAGEVALFNVGLPAANEARLLQLAPFALEEQVSEDLDDLHFAVGTRDAGTGLVPVAVVDRERVAEWLATAARLGLQPKALFAESDLAPLVPGHVTLLAAHDQLIVRNDRARAVALPADDAGFALATVLGPDADLSTLNVVAYATPEEWPQHEQSVEALRDRVASLRVQLIGGGLLGLLAQGISDSAPVNLLQGALKPQTATGVTWRRWRTVAALAAGLMVLHVAGALWELRQVRKSSTELDASIARVYGTIFPGQQPGPAPRRAIDARLKAVSGGGAPQGELMPLLAALAAAHQNVPVAKLNTITYKPGTLQLKLSAPDAATLEQFSQALRAGGNGAQVTSGTQREGGFEGQIDLKAAGA